MGFPRRFPLVVVAAARKLIAVSMLTIALTGCVSGGAVVTEPPNWIPPPTTRPVASLTPVATPVSGATTLVAVSASHPGAEAAGIFRICRVRDLIPIDEVAGMAKLPAAGDLPHYVPLTGREPQLKQPGPLWVIQIDGALTQYNGASPSPGGAIWTNPICFVTTSDFGFMATGPITDPTRQDDATGATCRRARSNAAAARALSLSPHRNVTADLADDRCSRSRRTREASWIRANLVPKPGFEPGRGCPQRCLRPPRLPFRHFGTEPQS